MHKEKSKNGSPFLRKMLALAVAACMLLTPGTAVFATDNSTDAQSSDIAAEEVTAEDSAENMNLSSEAKDRMTRINNAIHDTEGLNDAYKIGGAYFLNADDFDKLWRIKLSSLIKEYLRGIDDDGSKYQKIEDAYFNRNASNSSLNDTENNNPTVEQ